MSRSVEVAQASEPHFTVLKGRAWIVHFKLKMSCGVFKWRPLQTHSCFLANFWVKNKPNFLQTCGVVYSLDFCRFSRFCCQLLLFLRTP